MLTMQDFFDLGITPACAGSTDLKIAAISSPQDHPRMRGEHRKHGFKFFNCWGSPPHARGARPWR